jgi:hypothetical protein
MQDKKENSNYYDIFISYNTADIEFAELLVKRIEQESYQGSLLKCFYAPWDIEPGENLLLKIETALQKSRFVGIIISPDWLKSDWTTLERSIPVYQDPAGIKARIIPILRRNCDIPASIQILKWLDFRNDQAFPKEIKKLLARLTGRTIRSVLDLDQTSNIPSQPVDSVLPDIQNENLASNLFEVIEMPDYLNVAHSKIKRRSEVFTMLGETILPLFVLREQTQQVYSFTPLSNPQQKLSTILAGTLTERVDIKQLIDSEESSIIIELLNRAMTEHMKKIGMIYDWTNKKTFFPLEKDGDEKRFAKWKIGKREFTRIIVTKSKKGNYYAHRSCKATFTKVGKNLFLKIIPGWHFTTDGIRQPVTSFGMSSYSTRWMNIEQNHTVLDDARFWAFKLSGGKERIELQVGAEIPTIILSTPLFAQVNRGIEEDYRERLWSEEEPAQDEAETIAEKEEIEEEIEEEENDDCTD